ncbi:unnamed protein product [Parajaminaea phylloscopi]
MLAEAVARMDKWHVALACVAWWVLRAWFKPARTNKHIPGPQGLPILGNTLQVMRDAADPLQAMLQRFRLYNLPNAMTFLGGGTAINVSRPEWIEHIQKTNFANYTKGPQVKACLYDLLGGGIFNTDGAEWKMQRKAGAKIMTVNNLNELLATTLPLEYARVVERLDGVAASDGVCDLQRLFFDFTMATFLRMAFSTDLADLEAEATGSSSGMTFAEAFDTAQELSVKRLSNPVWRLGRRWSAEEKRLQEAIARLDQCIDSILEARARKAAGANKDLLDLFTAYRDEDGRPLSRKQMRDALLNFLLAGRDTTAESLSWAWFHLVSSPTVLERLRREGEEVFAWSDGDGRAPSLADIKRCDYTRSVYHETLRLHPSVPRSSKVALQDDVLPGGYVVKAGTTVIWSDWLMGRNEELWGADAAEWKPSRWMAASPGHSEPAFVARSPWLFHAFNGGPRLCLGIQMAQSQGIYVLSRLAERYDLTMHEGRGSHYEPRVANTLTLPMKDPLLVRVSVRPGKGV